MKVLKNIGIGILSLSGLMALIWLSVFLIGVAVEFSLWADQWTPIVFSITFAVSLFVLGPLALIPATRGFAAIGYMIAGFSFGAITWLFAMAFTYAVWGWYAIFVGIVLLGVGVVPVAMLAALWHAEWNALVTFAIMVVLFLGCRALSMWLAVKADERAERLIAQS